MDSRRTVVLAMVAGAFGSLDSALNVAFPDLISDLGLGIADLQWVVMCYLLSYGALLPVAGRFGDAIGHHRGIAIGAIICVGALVGCAVAPSFEIFLASRVMQGLGFATLMASAPALLTAQAESTRGSSHGVGLFQTAAAAGLAFGPIVGGQLVELAGWRGVFWFRVPIGIVIVVVASDGGWRTNAAPTRSPPHGAGVEGVDRLGMMLVSIGLGALVAAFSLGGSLGWGHPFAIVAVTAVVAAGWGFVTSSRRATAPLLNPDLFRSPRFRNAIALAVVANGAMFGTWLLVPTLLVDRIGTSAIVAGIALSASPVMTSAVSRPAAAATVRVGATTLTAVGLAIEAVGMGLLSAADSDWSPWSIAAVLAVVGLGLGIFTVPNMALVMDALPTSKHGVAGGLSLMTRTIGIVAGVAVASQLVDRIQPDRGFTSAAAVVFAASAVVLAAAAVAAWIGRGQPVSEFT